MSKGTVNKVILVGRLGADPEMRYTPNGVGVAHLRLATNETFKDKTGQSQDQTEWHRVVLFGKTAELAGQYLKKGASLFIEGRIRTNKWKDQSGQDRYSTEIVANEMQFMGGNREAENKANSSEASLPVQHAEPDDQFKGEDIPF